MAMETADHLIDMLRGAINRGTGQAIRHRFGIAADVAGKTGTTQNNTDGWFMLMHPQLVAGAWVGFNDARVTMRSSYWGQGGHNALFIVGDFYRQAFSARALDSRRAFPKPEETLFAALADRFDSWFGRSKPRIAAPVAITPQTEAAAETVSPKAQPAATGGAAPLRDGAGIEPEAAMELQPPSLAAEPKAVSSTTSEAGR
jgi:penicillin-binding protein 1A